VKMASVVSGLLLLPNCSVPGLVVWFMW
jgi:hypothetical protein